METKPVPELPIGDTWRYEPKWDGYRCLTFRGAKMVYLRSKRGTLLNRHFPEVVAGLAKLRPKKFVLDGELLVLFDGRPDFASLQLRMHPAETRVMKLSAEIPALMMTFDLLVDAKGKDFRNEIFDHRLEVLEAFTEALGRWS